MVTKQTRREPWSAPWHVQLPRSFASLRTVTLKQGLVDVSKSYLFGPKRLQGSQSLIFTCLYALTTPIVSGASREGTAAGVKGGVSP